ncbi:hypothetical protein BP6252_03595 [Coleophoma cylindrospora]|uniref:Uncharacterized protein n=1 Tax=Coleophoma cylindrospora TaxID=1849047 RepID=A0A3D8S842_9HELO|nr:hypothetical protein BP6252_03595 [Coleophoma cylindrospora]
MYSLVISSLVLGASALSVPRSSCSFGLTASGGESGTIGQLSDGQNRIGGGLDATTFTISNGGITDAAGRGCILTPSVEQFQCDQGVGPTYGFSIANNGSLISPVSGSTFYACPASDTEWNLYTTPVTGQLKCVEISLTASDCGSSAAASTAAIQTVTVTVQGDCGASASSPAFASTSVQSGFPATSSPEAASSAQAVTTQSTESSAAPSTSVPAQYSTPAVGPVPAESASSEVVSSIPVETATSVEASTAPVQATSPTEVSSAVETSIAVTESSVSSYPTPSAETSSYEATTPAETPTPVSSSALVETSSYAVTTPIISETSAAPTTSVTSTATYSLANSSSIWTTYMTSTAPLSSYTPSASASSVESSSVASASSCAATTLTGTYTNGNYQYPHLIIPVSSETPDTAAGTQYFGTISGNTSTIFNFDIPSSYAGQTCNLIFLLPLQSQLETSSYTFSGTGSIDFSQLSSAASSATTFDNAPSVESDLGTFTLTEGSSTLIKSFSCDAFAGTTATYEMSAVGDTYLYYFQDWNPSPLGIYITVC